MPTIGKDGEIRFRFDFRLLIGFLGLTASLAHTIVNINLLDTEYNLCEHICCTLEHNDPTRTYCLIAWTRSTMFSLPQVLQAQCLVSLKCRVNHTRLATSQCQRWNLTILLPTFGQIVWIQLKKKIHNAVTVQDEFGQNTAHHLSPNKMGQCRFTEYTLFLLHSCLVLKGKNGGTSETISSIH